VGPIAEKGFVFDKSRLLELGERHAPGYQAASPFPHAVIDDFLPAEVAEAAAAEFASLDSAGWDFYTDSGNTLKFATSDTTVMGPVLRGLVAEFNGHAFVEFLEALTGMKGIVSDPHLVGGGLHQLNPGGFLKVHADFNRHPRLQLDRRINALLYLNPGWQDDWGGAFELWPEDMSECAVKAPPYLNRLAIFNTTSTSYHGNPDPVACPEGNARRSLAFYYYTNGRPESEQTSSHSTLYQTPGRQAEAQDAKPSLRERVSWRDFVPPIALKVARRVRARMSGS
jgi:Rps23 Pro-64 3,4-dihydroxylase Tpa1-like proline 4-hydroxylase